MGENRKAWISRGNVGCGTNISVLATEISLEILQKFTDGQQQLIEHMHNIYSILMKFFLQDLNKIWILKIMDNTKKNNEYLLATNH